MRFQYQVRDPLGKTHRGTLEAASREHAAQQLARDGFRVQLLEEDDPSAPLGSLLGPRVSKRDIIFLTNQLAIMVDTGITLSAALDGILQQEKNPSLRKVLADLKIAVEAGENFSSALARYPKLFNKTYVALVRAAEASGGLGSMLERIAGYLRKEMETRSRVRAAMAYPGVMLVMALGVTVFLLTYVLPRFTPIFQSRGMTLPAPTRVVMAVSHVFVDYAYLWLAGVLAMIVGYVLMLRTPQGRQWFDLARLHLPVLGTMNRKVILGRSIRTLGTLLASDVPLLDALNLSAEVSGNCHYEKLWNRVRDEVTAGKRICDSLTGHPLVPPVLVQMIASGEEAGKLDDVLQRVSGYYEHEVETAIKAATSMLEPLMIGVMGIIVGGIGLALLLPIFSLSKPM